MDNEGLRGVHRQQTRASVPFVSAKESLILELLLRSGRELYGLEMVEASKGLLKRGTIYVTLQRMQEKGLVESRAESRPAPEIGIPRRLYTPTAYAQRVCRARAVAEAIIRNAPALGLG